MAGDDEKKRKSVELGLYGVWLWMVPEDADFDSPEGLLDDADLINNIGTNGPATEEDIEKALEHLKYQLFAEYSKRRSANNRKPVIVVGKGTTSKLYTLQLGITEDTAIEL